MLRITAKYSLKCPGDDIMQMSEGQPHVMHRSFCLLQEDFRQLLAAPLYRSLFIIVFLVGTICHHQMKDVWVQMLVLGSQDV